MTAHSLRILWRQTYNESLEDKGNTRNRVFLSEGFLPYIICDRLRALWLENRKYKLAVRSHLSERGSYSGLTLLGLPVGLTVVSDVLRARCIMLTFQRGWAAIILLLGSFMKWKIPFCTSERDPPLTCTLRPTPLHLDGVDIRGTLMKAGRLHTSSRVLPADHPPMISSMTQDKRRSARYQIPGGHGHTHCMWLSAAARNHWYHLRSCGDASFKGQRKKRLHPSLPTSALSFFLKVRSWEENWGVNPPPQNLNDK